MPANQITTEAPTKITIKSHRGKDPHHYHDPIRARWPAHGAFICADAMVSSPGSEPRRTATSPECHGKGATWNYFHCAYAMVA